MAQVFHSPAIADYSRTQPNHLATMQDIDDAVSGRIKAPVRVVAAVNQVGIYDDQELTFEYGADGVLLIDGVALAVGNRVLFAAQTTGTENGVYVVEDIGSGSSPAVLKRADDFDESAKILSGVRINVDAGTQFADSTWKLATEGAIILDTTALTFIKVSASQGTAKFATTIVGDDTETDFVIRHDLGTTDVAVAIRNIVSGAVVFVDWVPLDSNNIKLLFAIAPLNTMSFRVTVIG